jgi:endonuclease I
MRRLALPAALTLLAPLFVHADTTPQTLPFSQNWGNTGLITANDNWSGVPGIEGFLGQDPATTAAPIDPRTILGTSSAANDLDVVANQLDPLTLTSGGVAEFEIADPVVALQGSGTADWPHLLIRVITTGQSAIRVRYTLRDLDNDPAVQPVALQYRVGTSGNFSNVPEAYVANANAAMTGTTNAIDVTLPSDANNQAQVQIRVMTGNATGSDTWIGVDDIQITGGGPVVDDPPAVASTNPANGATGVALDSNLTVVFTEPVTLGLNWYTLNCATSGSVAGVTTANSSSSYTINPTPLLAPNELCTLTVLANQVTDTDGTPNQMLANDVRTFTSAVDNPPAVSSTTPANSAVNVPASSNITVQFSEPVDVTDWIDVGCGSPAVAQPGATSGSGTAVIVFDPTAPLPTGASCTALIKRSGILDRDGVANQPTADVTVNFTVNAGPSGYYAAVNPLNAATLRATLHQTIRGHTCYPYSNPTPSAWTILEAADQDPTPGNSGRVLDVYKNASYLKIVDRSNCPAGPTGCYNREHTWPNSLGFNDRTTAPTIPGSINVPNCPYTDTHMLYLSNEDYNSQRGNKAYDDCPGCSELVTNLYAGQGGGSGVYPGNSNWSGASAFEAWGKRKGDLARAILYMDIRYEGGNVGPTNAVIAEPDLIVTDNLSLLQTTPSGQFAATGYMGRLSTLLKWHRADPPDEAECLRNALIQSFQGNRNPYIDRPEWAGVVYEDVVFSNAFEAGCAL